MDLEKKQELEWIEAQKIEISLDLVDAAKKQLEFLAAVDRNRWLYDGPTLQRAIYRYNACWLPLLAKFYEEEISEGPLVVPLDCEWIWHCHRLNPVRYKCDCEELYGRILDNSNVVSSLQGTCKRQTEEIWNRLYPDEPYDFDLIKALSENASETLSGLEKHTKYDLISAVKRQSPFFYQVSRAHMNNDIFIKEAVARYKGFLHLIKRNRKKSIKCFCVPTYDIDLIWHTHQLHPVSYCKDLNKALGKILEHDDTDSDRTKGKKLDVGFSGTTKQWEETFGIRYWKAGAMYRGTSPSPLTVISCMPNILSKEVDASNKFPKILKLPEMKVVEVLLEFVGVKNLPDEKKGNLFVLFSKTQPDAFFNTKQKLTIFSESGEKKVALFQCEPTGELLFELVSHSASNLTGTKTCKILGTASLSLKEFLLPVSKLAVEKWLDLIPSSGNGPSKPIGLHIAVSFTVPTIAQHVLHMVRSRPFSKGSCFQLPVAGRVPAGKSCTRVIDETQAEVIRLQMRESGKAKIKENCLSRKQVIGITKHGETHAVAEFVGTHWSLMDSQWVLQLSEEVSENGHLFDIKGNRMVKVFLGRKLDYEPKYCEKQRNEGDFMTAVEFSAEHPYGKAVALLDLKSGYLKAKEEWFVLPGLISAFIVSHTLKKKGHICLTMDGKSTKEIDTATQKINVENEQHANLAASLETEVHSDDDVSLENAMIPKKDGSSNGDYGGEKGTAVKSGGCGGCGAGCGGGCGSMVNSSGCGGCGAGCGGCGSMVNSSGCGGCGAGCGGCGSMVNSSGCGGCGGGCGSGCGGGCGGGCGSKVRTTGCGSCGSGFVDDIKTGGETGNLVKINGCENPPYMEEAVKA
ncbi:glycine-rich domain-containing protein 1-like [Durio zibethinus]|uniref:Glycine-rich domain-containing protein 1-like n=1 Tax=Durio zibethinus TaxID=66656 RepID=A0A6P5ZE80_DURZI|nr:glycine-rich domain-containing protein 1-like [Durio zibethinus]